VSSQNDRTDASASGASGQASAKTETTASAKANAKKKHQQLKKDHKANPPAPEKKQQQGAKSIIKGNALGINSIKGIMTAQGNGNIQKELTGAAADDKTYGLDPTILDLVAKVKLLIHSNLVPVHAKTSLYVMILSLRNRSMQSTAWI
jgi:hypothetical protein